MRERKAARLLVINPAHEVLLFRFVHKDGALANAGQLRRNTVTVASGLAPRWAAKQPQ
jgi:hypothetical protein